MWIHRLGNVLYYYIIVSIAFSFWQTFCILIIMTHQNDMFEIKNVNKSRLLFIHINFYDNQQTIGIYSTACNIIKYLLIQIKYYYIYYNYHLFRYLLVHTNYLLSQWYIKIVINKRCYTFCVIYINGLINSN